MRVSPRVLGGQALASPPEARVAPRLVRREATHGIPGTTDARRHVRLILVLHVPGAVRIPGTTVADPAAQIREHPVPLIVAMMAVSKGDSEAEGPLGLPHPIVGAHPGFAAAQVRRGGQMIGTNATSVRSAPNGSESRISPMRSRRISSISPSRSSSAHFPMGSQKSLHVTW